MNERPTPDVWPSDPGFEARERTRAAVHRYAIDVHGPQVVVERSLAAGSTVTVRDVQPVAGLVAARQIRDHATRMVREYAEQARGDGVSWAELAEPLGLVEAADHHGLPRDEAAFEYVTEHRRPGDAASTDRLWVWRRPEARWTCTSCGQRITDRGPYEAAPFNNEEGHAETCARQRAEIDAYRHEWGET